MPEFGHGGAELLEESFDDDAIVVDHDLAIGSSGTGIEQAQREVSDQCESEEASVQRATWSTDDADEHDDAQGRDEDDDDAAKQSHDGDAREQHDEADDHFAACFSHESLVAEQCQHESKEKRHVGQDHEREAIAFLGQGAKHGDDGGAAAVEIETQPTIEQHEGDDSDGNVDEIDEPELMGIGNAKSGRGDEGDARVEEFLQVGVMGVAKSSVEVFGDDDMCGAVGGESPLCVVAREIDDQNDQGDHHLPTTSELRDAIVERWKWRRQWTGWWRGGLGWRMGHATQLAWGARSRRGIIHLLRCIRCMVRGTHCHYFTVVILCVFASVANMLRMGDTNPKCTGDS